MTFHRLQEVGVAKLDSVEFLYCHLQNALHPPQHMREWVWKKIEWLHSFNQTYCVHFFPFLLHVLSSSGGRTSKYCSETSWILQSCQCCELVRKSPTAYHPWLTCDSSAAGTYCRHKQHPFPEQLSTSNSIFYLTYHTPMRSISVLLKKKKQN